MRATINNQLPNKDKKMFNNHLTEKRAHPKYKHGHLKKIKVEPKPMIKA
jgi:hypothetical protein